MGPDSAHVTTAEEEEAMLVEYQWLLENQGKKLLNQLDLLIKECCRKLPMPNKVSSIVRLPANASLNPEKFLISTPNSDAVRCMLTVLGDNIVQADVSIRHAKSPTHVFRSIAQPETQWKLQQMQDVGNHVLKAHDIVKSAMDTLREIELQLHHHHQSLRPEMWGPKLTKVVQAAITEMQTARLCLVMPKKKSLMELQEYRPNKSFNPALPSDLLLSVYVSSSKIMCAAYHLTAPVTSKQSYQVVVGECQVQWLSDLLSLLTGGLNIAQDFSDKLTAVTCYRETNPADVSGRSPAPMMHFHIWYLEMTYFASWEEFAKAVEKLYAANPNQCRLVTKYKHKEGKLVLRMTDDTVCLQYATEQAQDVKRLEKLISSLMRHMVTKEH